MWDVATAEGTVLCSRSYDNTSCCKCATVPFPWLHSDLGCNLWNVRCFHQHSHRDSPRLFRCFFSMWSLWSLHRACFRPMTCPLNLSRKEPNYQWVNTGHDIASAPTRNNMVHNPQNLLDQASSSCGAPAARSFSWKAAWPSQNVRWISKSLKQDKCIKRVQVIYNLYFLTDVTYLE